MAKERINEREDRTIEITQSEQRENRQFEYKWISHQEPWRPEGSDLKEKNCQLRIPYSVKISFRKKKKEAGGDQNILR